MVVVLLFVIIVIMAFQCGSKSTGEICSSKLNMELHYRLALQLNLHLRVFEFEIRRGRQRLPEDGQIILHLLQSRIVAHQSHTEHLLCRRSKSSADLKLS